jgi:hypothetical protein
VTVSDEVLYSDVEELLFPGYLSATVVADGVTVSVRTAFPSEYQLIRVRSASFRHAYQWKCLYVSNTVWEIDGYVIPGSDTTTKRHMYDMVRSWSSAVLDAVYSAVSSVRIRANAAANLVEAYCYEDRSRSRWRMGGRRCPTHESPPWVVGMGANHVQRAWVGYNLAEDDRLRWENEWYAAKTITSSMVPKWVKQVNDREAARWNAEEERRRSVISKAKTGLNDMESPDGMVVHRHRTNDDLVEQMKRWQRGEFDDHDRIVQGYKDQIRHRHAEAERVHEQRMAALALASDPDVGATLVGYTPEQLAEMGRTAPEKTRRLYDGSHPGRLYDKYLSNDIRIGGLRPDGKGGEMDSPKVPISEAIEGRRVVLPKGGV